MFSRDRSGFIGGERFEHRKLAIVFPKIRPESAFVHLLVSEAMAADKHTDLTRFADHLVKSPGGRAPDLPVIKPDKADVAMCRKRADQRHDRHPLFQHGVDGIGHKRVLGGNDGQRLDTLAQ